MYVHEQKYIYSYSYSYSYLNNYLPFFIQYYCPIVQTDQNSQFYLNALSLFSSGSRQKFRINADPDPQHWK